MVIRMMTQAIDFLEMTLMASPEMANNINKEPRKLMKKIVADLSMQQIYYCKSQQIY